MKCMRCARSSDGGFTLLELMIAMVIMVIIFMGFLSSLTGAFLATNMAKTSNTSHATARRLLEEAQQLTYADLLLIDGNSLITDDGLAAKYQVFEGALNLLTVEVSVCRSMQEVSIGTLDSMSMDQFKALEAVDGSRVTFIMLSGGVRPQAPIKYVTETPTE